jgi:hypothetical protein
MDRGSPSHGFPTQPYTSSQEDFELSGGSKTTQSSQDFTRPLGFSEDFVLASKGGIFFGLVSYDPVLAPTLDVNIPNIGWVKDHVAAEIAAEQLTDGYIRGLFSSAGAPLSYNAGVFTLNKNLSAYTNDAGFLTSFTEADPTVGAHIKAISAGNISNWNTAFGWGNHASVGYKTSVTQGDVTQHQLALSITTDQISDFAGSVVQNLRDLEDVSESVSALQVLRRNSGNTSFEFRTLLHADLGNILGNGAYHLSEAQRDIAIRAATTSQSGYLLAVDWNTFNNKLDSSPGLLDQLAQLDLLLDMFTFEDGGTTPYIRANYNFASTYGITAYATTDVEFEDPDEALGLTKKYTITLQAGSSLVAKLAAGYTVPDGWTIETAGGTNADLKITHSLGKIPTNILVYSVSGGSKTILEGSSKYGNVISSSTDNILTLTSFSTINTIIEIVISF